MNGPGEPQIFPAGAAVDFSASYPEIPCKLNHILRDHPLLSIGALARLGEQLPEKSVEYNRGDLAIGADGKLCGNGLSIGATIRRIEASRSWAALKNIEQVPDYATLIATLLGELRPLIEARTGAMLKPQGFVFVSSPGAITPYHFDPEHNLLLQLRGDKTLTQFPAGDDRFAPDVVHETYHTGGGRELAWHDAFLAHGREFCLAPGEAVYVPVMAPHFVRNGMNVSVSLSLTWRSRWSFAEADARAFNGLLRRLALHPRAPGRFPARNLPKAFGWRVWRKLSGGH